MLGLKPIKLLPARERVASALRKAIISKSIPEGAELTLENTAQELGVSVTPVREAFQILARDGLLEVKQNKCAIVLGVTEKTIRERPMWCAHRLNWVFGAGRTEAVRAFFRAFVCNRSRSPALAPP